MATDEKAVEDFMQHVRARNPDEPEFHQAVEEIATSVMGWYREQSMYRKAHILERLTEPDRIVSFRVSWENDDREIVFNRAWRVQFSNVRGPYKGGMRFAGHVNQGVLKFLGFEQVFKNALTGLPMGGAKGGSNFDPKNKSDAEIMRFCQSLMGELHRHIGPDTDVPAGDIGVGEREISALFGQYLRVANEWNGVLTGKGCAFGGSAVRKEATGYGCLYFLEAMLGQHGHELEGKSVAISGSGNVALYAAQKAVERGAKVLSLSDSDGFVFIEDGLSADQFEAVRVLKEERRGRLAEFADDEKGVQFHEGAKPWDIECDIALPCATQNELDGDDAVRLTENGVIAVCEGANMPTTKKAALTLRENGVLHAPAKAANAGGVAVSGLELSQNAMRQSWSRAEVDDRLKDIMQSIHDECVAACEDGDAANYVDGANMAAFQKVASAMYSFGVY